VPPKLQQVIDMFQMFDPPDRTSMLLSYADQFKEVPPSIATLWARKQADGTLKLYFAVENPSGVSAKALAAILDKTLSGLPPSEIATVDCGIVEQIFRQNISMGKGMGLMAMVNAVQALAKAAR
jgi:sulfur transfer protein SufE